ncbi:MULTISPECIES: AMP-binding protein [Paenibacillus]|uniref:AMP-binding protein n=1 Tax=Paenibacillus TaxID=44249 RepID=UPI0022B91138|nr:AMP-binding protein [Paenibacillus caseinilyticus]MCZ8521748.1 AMP-binding protein [Paenibacillus caseinilyticus]
MITSIEARNDRDRTAVCRDESPAGDAAWQPARRTVHRCFEDRAEAVPLFTAVVEAGRELRYRELNARANRVALRLLEEGVQRGQAVLLAAEPSADMLAGLLGIWKSGAACLISDIGSAGLSSLPGYSGAVLGLGSPSDKPAYGGGAAESGRQWIVLDEGLLEHGDAGEVFSGSRAEDPALIHYPSAAPGSAPVQISHGELSAYCERTRSACGITSSDSAAWGAGEGSLSFLGSVLPYLLAGADVHLLERGLLRDGKALGRYLRLYGMTAAFLPERTRAALLEGGRVPMRLLLPQEGCLEELLEC